MAVVAALLLAGRPDPEARAVGEPPALPRGSAVGGVVVGVGRGTMAQASKADQAGILPGDVPWSGSGQMVTVPGTVAAPDTSRRQIMVLVRVESDLPVDPAVFAQYALDTLNDSRGWGDLDGVSFGRTDDPAVANVTLDLASPVTTSGLCASAGGSTYTSCGLTTSINLNANRWVYGADAFVQADGTLTQYHEYLLNHEFGHYLGHAHVSCPAVGALAPTMLQQTLRLEGCLPNGWPNP